MEHDWTMHVVLTAENGEFFVWDGIPSTPCTFSWAEHYAREWFKRRFGDEEVERKLRVIVRMGKREFPVNLHRFKVWEVSSVYERAAT